jgi:YidC/Oxa1 family membrane protein insertase
MDNVRLFLVITLVFIGLLLYQAWQQDYGPKPTSPTTSSLGTPSTVHPSRLEVEGENRLPTASEKETPTMVAAETPLSQQNRPLPSQQKVFVETDVFKLEIDTVGGDLRRVYLPQYPVSVKTPDRPFLLMNDKLPDLFVAQSGLLSQEPAPTHLDHYQVEQTHYQLAEKANTLDVKLTWQNESGIKVNKIYTFHRGSYLVEVKHIIENHTTTDWQGRLYGQFQRTDPGKQSFFIYTYTGGVISSPVRRYEKIKFSDISDGSFDKEQRPGWDKGWIAMLQHYFIGAWIPQPEQVYHYYTKTLSQGRYVLGLYGPAQTIAPNAQQELSLKLYVGPKLQDTLAEIAPSLELTVDYGWLWFIAQPLFWLLEKIHDFTGNWGWSIIILTILIKLAFFHLSATSYKSMANMRRIHPRLIALKERYGDDKARLNQAMMDLYKKEKINPLGGCLPILVQIPVFIALYWMLLESVEMRQADFMWWINDLSSPDPYFVLPLIMGATMLLQHHLNPAPLDPIQQKVMLMLPLIFTVFFAFFPSGLVLYWLVNNILSIVQQWVITKKIVGTI